ncbi:RecQ family ATP-dependent DNA helicase [Croceitalea rosinachiae]|uniref:ATP-dependent DNA helicase RecQ n=1 Tax=Croceitalea rosinachiae TaxID=3075596 RepID=A0ABU3AC82_9FLAO|nr:ATP-dependent DNA helicase RecQ [Croceitalea sp. F388]MDT0607794.1 ATP-dependent DNA helicase RecQ [Croceitalea sp. F388]
MLRNPNEILEKYWGYSTFKGSQERIITSILESKDILALMPTGGGKSVCYQVPALVLEGICIVVSPLVALIQNQVDTLKKMGVKAIALTGGIPFNELNDLLDNCLYGNYKFLYLSPERLQQSLIRERIQQMNVNLVAIDEAHCISQWGNDFRPAYLDCSVLRELQPKIPIIALTATATKIVVNEIVTNLHLSEPLVIKDSFSRKNIAFSVKKTDDKQRYLKELFSYYTESAIVYVRTRRKTIEVAEFLNKIGGNATPYHGGLRAIDKKEKMNAWLTNKTNVMVATNAFGMGVDKPDVRLVVHYQIPDSIENYFQEAGRAGRDGFPSDAVIITNNNDEELAKKQFLKSLPNTTFVKKCYQKLNSNFQIAYGEGNGRAFSLNFNAFCNHYQLDQLMTYNALRILDQNGVLSLSENFHQKTTVQFTASKDSLFTYLENKKTISAIVLMTLRTYGGIFDFETKINTFLLARKSGLSEKRIHQIFVQLQEDDIIAYKANNNDLEITFLVPREDEKSINRFAKKIKQFNDVKTSNLESMLSYLNENNACRSNFLLNYFGEIQKTNCGVCDVCKERDKKIVVLDLIKQVILEQLQSGDKTSRILVSLIDFEEKDIINAIKELLEDGLLQLNHKNQYAIRK